MKRVILVLITLIVIVAASGAIVAQRKIRSCIGGEVLTNDWCWQVVKLGGRVAPLATQSKSERVRNLGEVIKSANAVSGSKDYLLGFEGEIKYLVLLQNDYELKANGGFAGSYAVVTVKNGKPSIRFEDIYTPDGQVEGYVAPPEPIQAAFGKGGFYLRDSDWEPDFATAAKTYSWFFVKGKEVEADVILTLSFSAVKELVEILESIEVAEYGITLTPENVYGFLQSESEVGFFPGSTQKKDAITASGRAMLAKVSEAKWEKKLKISELLLGELKKKNIVIYSRDERLEGLIGELGWSGEFEVKKCPAVNCVSDLLRVIEVNLGANKANCCVTRQTEHFIARQGESIEHRVVMSFRNESITENPIPPLHYGGNYINYLRYYVPLEAYEIAVMANPSLPRSLVSYPTPYQGASLDGVKVGEKYGLKEIGFFHTTRAGEKSEVELSYKLKDNEKYWLQILKQNGVRSSPQVIEVFGEKLVTDLDYDFGVLR